MKEGYQFYELTPVFDENTIFDAILTNHPLLPYLSKQILVRNAQRLVLGMQEKLNKTNFHLGWQWMFK